MNLVKIVLHKSDGIMIYLMDKNTNEVIWSEKIIAQELYTKVLYNVERFIKEIQKQNPLLLKSNMLGYLLKEKMQLLQNDYGLK